MTFDVIENLAHKSRQTAEANVILYKSHGEPTLLMKSTIFIFGPAQSCTFKKFIVYGTKLYIQNTFFVSFITTKFYSKYLSKVQEIDKPQTTPSPPNQPIIQI